MTALLDVQEVTRTYRSGGVDHVAVDSVSFSVAAGKTIAIVGESGAGKSTLARMITGLESPTSGSVLVGGRPPVIRRGKPSEVQMVFQHPLDALNPLRSIGASIASPLHGVQAAERRRRVAESMAAVGLDPDRAGQRPRAFSGGQLQRVVIARALAADPRLLLCDEPTSSLDVSVQAQIVNLLLALQEEHRFGCVLVTHDLAVARVLADEILVLRAGRTVEHRSADEFFGGPIAEYSRALLAAHAHEAGGEDAERTMVEPRT
ncbi:MAG: peptide/nickel transport system ATP-binding protein [Solirubrobacteraceae bacterium]